MRADRLLSIMLLLQVHRRLTARDLAKRLEVSERTIYRDIEALSAAGVPVTSERGIGGGLMLLEAFRTNLTGLNSTEIQTLFLGQPAHVLNDLGLHRASEAALIKLLAVLPAINRQNAEAARQRIYVDVAGWQRGDEERLEFLPLIQEAIWQERKVAIAYQRGEQAVERVLDPLGLVAKGRAWYLVAAVDESIRTYRVSRIQQARVLQDPCLRPPDFDLAGYWHESSSRFLANIPREAVSVRLSQEALRRASQAGRSVQVEQVGQIDEEDRVTACLLFDNPRDEICGYLLSFGATLEILGPQEIRAQAGELARQAAALYSQGAETRD